MLVLAVLSAVAAHGCAKRRSYGWWIVALALGGTLAISVPWLIGLVIYADVPLLARLLGGAGELVPIALVAWILFKVWIPKKKDFGETARR